MSIYPFNASLKCFVLLVISLLAGLSLGHNLDKNQTGLSVEGNKALLLSAPPSQLFLAFDDDNNGHLSVTEVQHHRNDINALFSQNVKLLDQQGQEGELYFFDVLVPNAAENNLKDSDHLQFIRRYSWQDEPSQLSIHYNLLKKSTQAMTLNIKIQGQTHSTVLTAKQPSFNFPKTKSSSFLRFIALGFFHVLSGYDHLLFLLALMVTACHLHKLIALTTAFTLAHSLTLALTSLGVISLSTKLIETSIVLSICFVALEPLICKSKHFLWRWFVVFAFGLIHGMGFASFLQDASAAGGFQVLSLLAFNVGVELAQVLFIVAAFALLYLLYQQKYISKNLPLLTRNASLVIAGVAFIWSLERFLS